MEVDVIEPGSMLLNSFVFLEPFSKLAGTILGQREGNYSANFGRGLSLRPVVNRLSPTVTVPVTN